MTYIAKPKVHHPGLERNALGLTRRDYEGSMSTLCAGCGHDSVTAAIVDAFWALDTPPHRVAKLSGIGCSAKTPTYFMSSAHGFNAVHGRMPSIATGVACADQGLVCIGISGDGDSLSIGIGQLCHAIRRNVNMLYVLENNGVYGLTKGQFSATADRGTKLRKGGANPWDAVDIPSLAIQMGATFVARSFSGDRKQLAPLIEAALNHKGTAVLDVLSPCVTFNDHEGSTKSLKNIRANRDALHDIDFIPDFDDVDADYEEGEEIRVRMHEAGMITLHKIKDHDPRDRRAALDLLEAARSEGKFATGLLYIDEHRPDFATVERLPEKPLSWMGEEELRPGPDALEAINAQLML